MKMKTKRKKKIRDSFSSSSAQTSDSKSTDLHTAVVRIAVAQICTSIGYTTAQTSALETLTNVAVRYIQSLAKSAAASATSTGRTQCNLLDILRALEDLHSDVGFRRNSDVNRRLYILSDSSILRDTMKFVYRTREIPFAKALPRRLHTVPSISPNFSIESNKLNRNRIHIPRWLPDFPKIAGIGDKIVEKNGEKAVAAASNEGETGSERKFCTVESSREISKLPERRKKVSFTICGGNQNVMEIETEIDLRRGICKGGKRILCQIYDDDDCKYDSKGKQSMKKKL